MSEKVGLAVKKPESKGKDSDLAKTKTVISPSVEEEKKGTAMKILVLFVIGPFFGRGIFYMDIFGRGIFCMGIYGRGIYGRGLIYQALYRHSSLGFDESNPFVLFPVRNFLCERFFPCPFIFLRVSSRPFTAKKAKKG